MADWHIGRKDDAPDTNDDGWEDAANRVAWNLSESETEEAVSILANADDVLTWLSHAVEVPQHHLHAFRDLIKLASGLSNEVETEMKANRSYPDGD